MSFSKLWRQKQWQLVIGRDSVVLWAGSSESQPLGAVSVWPRQAIRDWHGLLRLAEQLLAQQQKSRSDIRLHVLLAWQWQRAMSQPWREDGEKGKVQAPFVQAFGMPEGGWRLKTSSAGYRRPSMVFGMEQLLYDALAAMAKQHGLLLSRVEPAALAALSVQSVSSTMMIIEPGSVLLLQFDSGHLRSLIAERWEDAPVKAIEQLWHRSSLRQPLLADSTEISIPVLDLRARDDHQEVLRLPAPFLQAPTVNSALGWVP